MDRRTYAEAVAALERIVARYDEQIIKLGSDSAARRRVGQVKTKRAAVAGALEELREGGADDTADVPRPVMELTEWLNQYLSASGIAVPVHPHAGANLVRTAVGGVGHCWVCVTVGHFVAHPERGCADVGCTVAEDDDDEGDSDGGPVDGPEITSPPVAPPDSAVSPVALDFSVPPEGPPQG